MLYIQAVEEQKKKLSGLKAENAKLKTEIKKLREAVEKAYERLCGHYEFKSQINFMIGDVRNLLLNVLKEEKE